MVSFILMLLEVNLGAGRCTIEREIIDVVLVKDGDIVCRLGLLEVVDGGCVMISQIFCLRLQHHIVLLLGDFRDGQRLLGDLE